RGARPRSARARGTRAAHTSARHRQRDAGAHPDRARHGLRPGRRPRSRRRRLPGQAVRSRRAAGAAARPAATRCGTRRAPAAGRRSGPRSGHPRGHSRRPPGGAVATRTFAAPRADVPPGRGAVAGAPGGAALRLGRRDCQQRRRSPHPQPATQTRQRPDSHRARLGLLDGRTAEGDVKASARPPVSIRTRLLVLVLGATVLTWLVAVTWSYLDARRELAELFD